MSLGWTITPTARTPEAAKRGWGVFFVVALACLVGFAAAAFRMQSWLLVAAFCAAALAQPQRIGAAVSRPRFLVLLAFSILYLIASMGSFAHPFPTFAYPIAFLTGFLLAAGPKDEDGRFSAVIIAGVVGSTIHGTLNAASNFKNFGWDLPGRVLPDFWTQEPLTATLQGTLFVPLAGFVFYALWSGSGHHTRRVLLTMSAVSIAVGYNLATASRTLFVVGALTFGVLLLAALRTRPRAALGLSFIAGVALLLYYQDILRIRSLAEGTPLARRMAQANTTALGEDPRFERWQYFFGHFWDYTKGGGQFRAANGYAHNLWLDVYDVAGLPSLILLLCFSLSALALMVRVIRSPLVASPVKFLIGGQLFALLAQFMTEPILDGVPYLFALFCLMVGATDGLLRDVGVTKVGSARGARIAK